MRAKEIEAAKKRIQRLEALIDSEFRTGNLYRDPVIRGYQEEIKELKKKIGTMKESSIVKYFTIPQSLDPSEGNTSFTQDVDFDFAEGPSLACRFEMRNYPPGYYCVRLFIDALIETP